MTEQRAGETPVDRAGAGAGAGAAVTGRGRSRPVVVLLFAVLGVALSGCPETLDLKTGRFYACSRDGGPEQCSTGWRCGLEGYCHPATGAAWLCADDGDCDGVWRCGTDGVCVNPTADALIPRQWPSPAPELVSPRYAPSKIDLAAASGFTVLMDRCDFEGPASDYPYCNRPIDESISFAASGKLVQVMRLPQTLERASPPGAGVEFLMLDGGHAPRGSVTTAALPFTPAAMAVYRFQTLVLGPGGRLNLMDATLGGGTSTIRPAPFDVPAPFAPDALKLEEANGLVSNAPIMAAYERGGTHLAVYSLDDGGTSGAVTLPPGVTGGAILDLEMWSVPASLLLTTEAGLFVANRSYDGFIYQDGGTDLLVPEFLPLPALAAVFEDGGTSTIQQEGYKPVRTWVLDRPWWVPQYEYMVVESVRGSGPTAVHRVSVGGWDYDPTGPSGYLLGPPLDTIDCDPGDQVAAVDVHDFFSEEELVVICRQPGGMRPDVLKQVRGVPGCRVGCQVTAVANAGIGTQGLSGPNRSGWFDAHGRIFFDEYGVGQNTLTLDRAPVAVVGGKGSLEAWTISDRLLPSAGTEHFVEGAAGVVQALGDEWYLPPRVGGVRGQSLWRIQDAAPVPVVTGPQDGGQAVLFTMPGLSDLRQGPFAGQAVVVAGRPGVVVSAFDSFLSGEAGGDRKLQVRVVPNPRAAITSFDLAPTPLDAGTLLDGYAIAQARLFRITAETPLRWLSSEVPLNVRGEPRKVWLDQGRGRVGFADGRVFSLPSRVLLAPQLPEVQPEAFDFAFTCGHAFALGRRGLYRLDVGGSGLLGTWAKVDLDAVVAGAAVDPGWEGGVLHPVDEPSERAVYVITAHGNVARIPFDPQFCP